MERVWWSTRALDEGGHEVVRWVQRGSLRPSAEATYGPLTPGEMADVLDGESTAAMLGRL